MRLRAVTGGSASYRLLTRFGAGCHARHRYLATGCRTGYRYLNDLSFVVGVDVDAVRYMPHLLRGFESALQLELGLSRQVLGVDPRLPGYRFKKCLLRSWFGDRLFRYGRHIALLTTNGFDAVILLRIDRIAPLIALWIAIRIFGVGERCSGDIRGTVVGGRVAELW